MKNASKKAGFVRRDTVLVVGLTLISVVILFGLDVASGSTSISLRETLRVLFGDGGEKPLENIIFRFRLPRAVTAASAGAGLALSGLFLQTLFRNPLAGPSVLGITAGANLGVAATVLLLGGGGLAGFTEGLPVTGRLVVTLSSVLGAVSVLAVVLTVARFVGSATVVLLFGIMFGYAANSLVSIFIHFSAAEKVQSYIQWSFGSFDATMWSDIRILVAVLAAVILGALLLVKPLNLFLLGEEYAGTMGVAVRRTRFLFILVSAVASGVVHAFCGPVVFLGVAAPHIARGITGTSNHEVLVPVTIFVGAATALAADIVGHLPGGSSILPLNAVTALIGAPILIWVLIKSRSGKFFL